MRKSFAIFIFALLFVVNICAQSPKANRAVTINDLAFDDPKSGISELVNAYNRIDAEFSVERKTLDSINLEIAKIDKEIIDRTKPAAGCVGSIDGLIKEREKLLQEHNQKREDAKQRFDKRSSEIISPVLEKVESALKEFERVKGYNIIKMSSIPQIVTINPDLDRTAEFIEFYNNRALIR